MISGMSSICLESMSLGVPVIVVESLRGLSYNPIPEEAPQDLSRSCRTLNDIANAIEYYQNQKDVPLITTSYHQQLVFHQN